MERIVGTAAHLPAREGPMRRALLLAAVSFVPISRAATMQEPTLTLLIIRHAEKPGEAFPGPGLTLEGVPNAKSLVARGWQRAGAWAGLFGTARTGAAADFPRPDRVYASKPNYDPAAETSARPFETAVPVAQRLGLTVQATHAVGQEAALAAELAGLSGVVLVAWEHKMICATMLPAILGGQPIAGLPRKWPDDRYDIVLRLDRPAPGAPWTFKELFPRLMAGDGDLPI